MSILGRAVIILLSAIPKVAKQSPAILPLHLTGNGRTCMGYFHLTQHTLTWKTHFLTCRGDSWTASQQGDTWYLKVHQTDAQAKVCTIGFIMMKKVDPSQPLAGWQIGSYKSEEVFRKDATRADLGCWEQP